MDINLLNLKISEMAKMKLLNLDDAYIETPNSQFLKEYKIVDEEY